MTVIALADAHFDVKLVDVDDLPDLWQKALEVAKCRQLESLNKKYCVGAAAVAADGTIASVHNGESGTTTHAEQRVIGALYAKTRNRSVEFIAIAGSRPQEPLISRNERYRQGTRFDEVKWGRLCGKCLEFVHDCTQGNKEIVAVGSYADSGQIMFTDTRSLMPAPHISFRVPLQCDGRGNLYPVPSVEENKNDHYGCGLPPGFKERWPQVVQWLGRRPAF
ncbi:MAG TPA: hypothetical protein VG984_00750 [Candidatus Paceibacterota bacterium]|nr:hypothetical protein [Candidatus Paceibacterota bacterium]